MKILLISANTEMINMPVLPLGMACMAAAVQNAGHEVKTVNLMACDDTHVFIENTINEFNPQVIGISVRNIDDMVMGSPKFMLEPVKSFVNICKSLTKAPVVLGGAGYSIFPGKALEFLGADMGIQGEGEKAFLLLLERLEQNAGLMGIPGLFTANHEHKSKTVFTRDLDKFPMPVPNIHLSIPQNLKNEEIWMPFQTRRGCPMNCAYCSTPVIEGTILRKRSPVLAVENLVKYAENGFDRFFFVDNTFNLPPGYAEALCDEIIKKNLKIKWRCIFYPRKTGAKLIEKMAKAGCVQVSMGFESGSPEILKNLNKKFSPEDIRHNSDMLKSCGIARMGFLLLGGPGETRETVEQSFAFAESLNPDAVKLTAGIRIFPHTPLFKIAEAQGIIDSKTNLLYPVFYMAQGIEDWLKAKIKKHLDSHPNWKG